jgi:catechol 2,3-dioxygenase-like lactoylglutathione lyase family enzyme
VERFDDLPVDRSEAMPATTMNHFTIMTDDVEKTVAFYGRYLDLRSGPRPPFDFPGAWLYARDGSEAILHVLGGRDRERLVRGVIDHMAFTARDLGDVVALLEADGITRLRRGGARAGRGALTDEEASPRRQHLLIEPGTAE